MRKLFLTLLFITFFSSIAKSQDGQGGIGLDLGYTYNRKSWGNVGLSLSFSNGKHAFDAWYIGGGAGVNF